MKLKVLIPLLVVVPTSICAMEIQMVPDNIEWRTSELEGYKVAMARCTICHSAHYAEYQPPNTLKSYWNAQVLRMKNVFNCPIADDEVPLIVEYLNSTYGSNRKP